MEQKKIILVDDLNFHLLSIKERLKRHYEVFPAQTATIMFKILENMIPDLILLDINMPNVNGFEIIKQLKEDNRFANIPVIFLTAQNDRSSAFKGLELGAVDFVAKPFAAADLIDCIESAINPRSADKPVVLAVDDSPSILETIGNILNKDYTVYTLKHPELIKEVLKKIAPDLFLLDYQMPQMTGFDLVPIIRKKPIHKETPIVFLTSEGTADNMTEAVSLGASGFLVKPIDEVLLLEKVAAELVDYRIKRRIRVLET